MFESLFDILVNIDKYATYIVSEYQIWTYAILFVVIFMETGLVITPFLPGDSLLFVVGSLSALPGTPLDVNIIALVVFIAAVLGDTCNYFVGHYLGQRCFANRNSKIFKRSYLTRIHAFFWMILFCYGDYLFGDITFVQENMNLFIILIIIVTSAIPMLELARSLYQSKS